MVIGYHDDRTDNHDDRANHHTPTTAKRITLEKHKTRSNQTSKLITTDNSTLNVGVKGFRMVFNRIVVVLGIVFFLVRTIWAVRGDFGHACGQHGLCDQQRHDTLIITEKQETTCAYKGTESCERPASDS